MIDTIIFIGAALCISVGEGQVCQNLPQVKKNKAVFTKTVTDWRKITPETNYNIDKEVKIEQNNIRPRH